MSKYVLRFFICFKLILNPHLIIINSNRQSNFPIKKYSPIIHNNEIREIIGEATPCTLCAARCTIMYRHVYTENTKAHHFSSKLMLN